jgi:hypothetical protein
MSSRRLRTGLAVVALGAGLSAVAGIAGPRAVLPLYDGVVPIAPFQWLSPPPGQPGGAKGVSQTLPVADIAASPVVAVHTPEQPPQAQLVAGPGTLILPAGTTSIAVSIDPVTPSIPPPDGQLVGNVYRVTVVNQAGAAVTARVDGEVTLSLRGPANVTPSWFEQLSGGSWKVLESAQAGFPYSYETTGLTSFGDFALVGHAARSTGLLDAVGGLRAAAFGGLILIAILALAILVLRRRRARAHPPR